MTNQFACGLLMYRNSRHEPEFFLVHPGGPFFKNKREGVWSIPKGIPEPGEDELTTAIREFTEETGITPNPPYIRLKPVKQKSGKVVHAWAFAGEWDSAAGIKSNTFDLEWPPKSGKIQHFPEQDEGAWMTVDAARIAINPAQFNLIEQLIELLRK